MIALRLYRIRLAIERRKRLREPKRLTIIRFPETAKVTVRVIR